MAVSADKQGFGTGSTHPVGFLTAILCFDFVKSLKGSVAGGDRGVVASPDTAGGVAVAISTQGHGLEPEKFLVPAVIGAVVVVGQNLFVPWLGGQVGSLVINEVVA